MNWIENVLIIAGVSLDIFAAMECQGALVAKVDKKQLSVICALIAVWQLCALALGNYLSGLLYRNELHNDEKFCRTARGGDLFRTRHPSDCEGNQERMITSAGESLM